MYKNIFYIIPKSTNCLDKNIMNNCDKNKKRNNICNTYPDVNYQQIKFHNLCSSRHYIHKHMSK